MGRVKGFGFLVRRLKIWEPENAILIARWSKRSRGSRRTPTDALLGLDANRYFKLEKRVKSLEQQLATEATPPD